MGIVILGGGNRLHVRSFNNRTGSCEKTLRVRFLFVCLFVLMTCVRVCVRVPPKMIHLIYTP